MAVVATPGTLTSLQATGLRRASWDKKLRELKLKPSIWKSLKGTVKYAGKEMVIENSGIVIDVKGSGGDMGQSHTLAMRKPYTLSPQLGTTSTSLGNEDEGGLYQCTVYWNEIRKAVKSWGYGYNYRDTSYLNRSEAEIRQMAQFFDEYDDYRYQQAGLVTFSEELVNAGTSLAQQFNKNWYLGNYSTNGTNPAWDVDALTITNSGTGDSNNYYNGAYRTYGGASTFVQNIGAALLSASGTSATPNVMFNLDHMADLLNFLRTTLTMPTLDIDGMPTIIVTLPFNVYAYMVNPANANTWGAYIKGVSTYKDPNRMPIPGEIGRIFETILLVANDRAPVLKVSGTEGSYTIQLSYVLPGNNDARNMSAWSATSGSTNYVFDIAMAWGADAIIRYSVDELKMDYTDETEYQKILGRLGYKGEGIQLARWDVDNGPTTSQYQNTSCVIPIARHAINTVA